MEVLYGGRTIAWIITNRSLTVTEALYAMGYDITCEADRKKAYDKGLPAAYIDDYGHYQIDTERLEMKY